jgi:hypothetical protein
VWATTNVTVASDDEVAPDGTTTADKLTASAATGDFFVVQSITSVSGQTYVASVFAKAGTNNYIQLAFGSQTGSYANFDITSGAGATGTSAGVTSTAIQDVGNGWFRCSVVLSSSGFTNVVIALADSDSMGRLVDWTAAGTETVYLWGAQLEQRSSVTSYTPTTTQPITNYIPVLLTAPANVARFDHNPVTEESLGLLIEEQRTNLQVYSQEFDNAAWTKTNTTITSNTIVAPDGTLTGDKLVENTATDLHRVIDSFTFTATQHSLSVFAKAGERSEIRLFAADLTKNMGVYFNLSSGTVGSAVNATGQITNVGNGWYRCAMIFNPVAASGNIQFLLSDSETASYTGDGYSGIYIWGAQLEAGAFPTSYIPTVASTVTRNADVASMTGSNFTSWFNNGEGTFYAEFESDGVLPSGNFGGILEARQDSSKRIFIYLNPGESSNIALYVQNPSGVAVCNLTYGLAAQTFGKFAGAYKANDFAAVLNNLPIKTDTSGDLPYPVLLNIGNNGGVPKGRLTISKVAYYPERLPNEQLQALTGS